MCDADEALYRGYGLAPDVDGLVPLSRKKKSGHEARSKFEGIQGGSQALNQLVADPVSPRRNAGGRS